MISTLVIKAIRACNLRCPYCYYINDQTPHYGLVISAECIERLYESYAAYADGRLEAVNLIWHGGEPLMLGRRRFQHFLDLQRQYFRETTVLNRLQSNGIMIDDAWADFFEANSIDVGISLDGPPEVHDRMRVNAKGEGSFAEVSRAIRLLQERGRPAGVLAVATADADGAAVLDCFTALGVEACDLLIPMTNHGIQRRGKPIDMAEVGTQLRAAFRKWITDDDPSLRIRLFEALFMNALGGRQNCANAGARAEDNCQYVVVETTGDICMDTEFAEIDRFGLGKEYYTGLSVLDPDLSFAQAEAVVRERFLSRGLDRLPDECQRCPVRSVCRASHPASRFDDRDGSYNHRSAYCEAMYPLCHDVVDYLAANGYRDVLFDPVLREAAPVAAVSS